MQTFERALMAAFGLIVLYLLFNAANAESVIGGIAASSAGIFGTLQGRAVEFPGGVRIT